MKVKHHSNEEGEVYQLIKIISLPKSSLLILLMLLATKKIQIGNLIHRSLS